MSGTTNKNKIGARLRACLRQLLPEKPRGPREYETHDDPDDTKERERERVWNAAFAQRSRAARN
jgi:hypothetical protein